MFSPHEYCNRNLDAQIMLNHLESGRAYTTEEVQETVDSLEAQLSGCIRNYQDTRKIDRELTYWRLLLASRNIHTDPIDDCSHWI